jgi:hypothetical protein
MKYSNKIGLLSALLLIWACTQKWVTIETAEKYLTGFNSTTDNNIFGRPGKLHWALCFIAAAFFAIPKVWAKRTNLFITALNLAFGIRNFFAIGMTCRGGVCPTKETGIYIIFICSILMFIMSLLPKLEIKENKN